MGYTGLKTKNIATAYGETDDDGNLVVLGTEDTWTTGCTKDTVFDGNTTTFFDGKDDPAWAGFHTTTAVTPTRIRFIGRKGYAFRIPQTVFEAANEPDFSDAVTLYVATEGITGWQDVSLDFDIRYPNGFTYFRVRGLPGATGAAAGSCCGNMAEVEFYGEHIIYSADRSAPTNPGLVFGDAVNGYANFMFSNPNDALAYIIERRPTGADESAWQSWQYASFNDEISAYPFLTVRDTNFLVSDTDYRLAFLNFNGTSDWCQVSVKARNVATGTWIGTQGCWDPNTKATGDKVFDGNVATYCDLATGTGWMGLDLGEAKTIVAIRYVPRDVNNFSFTRMNGGRFEYANDAEFTDPQLIATISKPTSFSVYEITLDQPITARYFRYVTPEEGYGNASEIEFVIDGPSEVPQNLAVVRSDLTNQYARLTWENNATQSAYSGIVVQRSTSPGGPYETIANLAMDVQEWQDEEMKVGVRYCYRIGYVFGEKQGALTDYVAFRRCKRLDRDWEDLTQLKTGITAIWTGTPWGGSSNDARTWFDNNLSTFGDLDSPAGGSYMDVYAGVDFGEGNKVNIGFYRFYPRQESYGLRRCTDIMMWGSNNTDSWIDHTIAYTPATTLPTAYGTWYEYTATNSAFARYVYFSRINNSGDGFMGAFAEVELYGWTPDDVAGLLTPPNNLGCTFNRDQNTIIITWQCGDNSESQQVERKLGDGDWETLGTIGSDVSSFTDTSFALNAGRYSYRVVALNAGAEAVSDSVSVTPYELGEGTGLHGTYRSHYTIYGDSNESVVRTAVDANLNFNWGTDTLIPELEDATDNVFITWTGKLIVPVTGEYNFIINADDYATLDIDGNRIHNHSHADSAQSESAAVKLTAGEHDIMVKYFEVTGSANIQLSWKGIVDEEVIPSTQFKPVELAKLPEPWIFERSYGNVAFGKVSFIDASNFRISGAGVDFYQSTADGYAVSQLVKGSFETYFDYEYLNGFTVGKIMLFVHNGKSNTDTMWAVVTMPNNGNFTVKYRTDETQGIADLQSWIPTYDTTGKGGLKILRKGNTLTAYYHASVLSEWKQLATQTFAPGVLNSELYVGVQILSASKVGEFDTPLVSADIKGFTVKPKLGFMFFVR